MKLFGKTHDAVFQSWRNKYEHKKNLKRKDVVNTFYGKERVKDWSKRFVWTHYFLKYKLLVPAMKIFYYLYQKKLAKTIPDKPQFKYIKIWDQVFNQTVINWKQICCNPVKPIEKGHQTRKEIEKDYHSRKSTAVPLKLIKEIANTIFVNDDAYAEILPFFLWEIYYTMHAEYAHLQDKEGKIHHLLHNQKGPMEPIKEIVYLKLVSKMNIETIPSGRTLCDERYDEEVEKVKAAQKKEYDLKLKEAKQLIKADKERKKIQQTIKNNLMKAGKNIIKETK